MNGANENTMWRLVAAQAEAISSSETEGSRA